MQKSELSGPLPSDGETDAYLCRELGVAPGTVISLSLNEKLRSSDTCIKSSRSPWKSARVACLLAIRGSERQALTTKEIFGALIKAVPFCAKNSHLVRDPPTGVKRKGWPVRTSFSFFLVFLWALYKSCLPRLASSACFPSTQSSSRKPLKGVVARSGDWT